jgi:phosphatidylserine/phosphatidylglycerophosphate/cardiolipin synthase-like enzyme
MMRIISIAIVGILTCRVVESAAEPTDSIVDLNVYVTPHEHVSSRIESELRGATNSIDIAMFHLSDDGLVSALCEISSRKRIPVRVFVDSYMATDAHRPRLEKLASNGVEVFALNIPGTAKLHLKAAIIDASKVITGAANWSDQGFAQNYDDVLFFTSSKIASQYKKHLDHLLAADHVTQIRSYSQAPVKTHRRASDFSGSWGKPKTQGVMHLECGEPVRIISYISPLRDGIPHLVHDIMCATNSIAIGIYLITDKAIIEELSRLAQSSNVSIEVIVDDVMLEGSNRLVLHKLRNAGVRIRFYKHDRSSMHLKCAVIDRRVTWTGSMNWTAAAMNTNIENMLRLDSSEVAQYYDAYLQRIAAYSHSYDSIQPAFSPSPAIDQSTAQQPMARHLRTGTRSDFADLKRIPILEPLEIEGRITYLANDAYYKSLISHIKQALSLIHI